MSLLNNWNSTAAKTMLAHKSQFKKMSHKFCNHTNSSAHCECKPLNIIKNVSFFKNELCALHNNRMLAAQKKLYPLFSSSKAI